MLEPMGKGAAMKFNLGHALRMASLAGLLLTAACAFGDRHVNLAYKPMPAPAGSAQHGVIIVDPFTDKRADKTAVGTVRNTYYMHTADAVTSNDVGQWATEAVRIELKNSGYQVVEPTDAAADVPHISGDVTAVNCNAYLNYTGEITIVGLIKQGGKELLNGIYSGKGGAGLNVAATSDGYAECLNDTLGKTLKLLLADMAAKNIAP
jgi:hypothetical protein